MQLPTIRLLLTIAETYESFFEEEFFVSNALHFFVFGISEEKTKEIVDQYGWVVDGGFVSDEFRMSLQPRSSTS